MRVQKLVLMFLISDKIVDDKVLVELKCKEFLTKQDIDQFWRYLKGSQYKVGLLINFGPKKLDIRRTVYDEARVVKDPRVDRRKGSAFRSAEKGFTLIELLISIALIGVVTVAAIPVYREVQGRNELDITANTVAQTLRRAQTLAQGMDGDTSWGMRVAAGSITMFRGASYATRDASLDEVFDVVSTITPSGLTEVVFSKFTGNPTTTGTTTLTGINSETRTLTVNAKGTITY